MGKLFKAAVYVFAVIGVLVSGFGGYVYATNSELVNQFWEVRGDFNEVSSERRVEVIAELPARITFERDVRENLAVLPEERQQALYEQLKLSRESVFESFSKRIAAEAKIVSSTKDVKEAVKKITRELGKIEVKVNLTRERKPAKRRPPDPLRNLKTSLDGLFAAQVKYDKARGDTNRMITAGLGVLRALDRLGNQLRDAKRKNLDAGQKSELKRAAHTGRMALVAVRQTPRLDDNPAAKKLLTTVGPKLTAE